MAGRTKQATANGKTTRKRQPKAKVSHEPQIETKVHVILFDLENKVKDKPRNRFSLKTTGDGNVTIEVQEPDYQDSSDWYTSCDTYKFALADLVKAIELVQG